MQVAIIGLGYVGLPRALQFCEKQVKVIGLDVDEKKIKDLKNKKSYITNISSKKIKKAIEKNILIASGDFVDQKSKCYNFMLTDTTQKKFK